MKKAQGLSMQTIVLAALALFVLLILFLIISDRFALLSDTDTCSSKNGVCASAQGGSCDRTHPITIWTPDCQCQGGDTVCKVNGKQKEVGQCCLKIGN